MGKASFEMPRRSAHAIAQRKLRTRRFGMPAGGLLAALACGVVGYLLARDQVPGSLRLEAAVAMFVPAAAYAAWWLLFELPKRRGRGAQTPPPPAEEGLPENHASIAAAATTEGSDRAFTRPKGIPDSGSRSRFAGQLRVPRQTDSAQVRRSLAGSRSRRTPAATHKPQAAS